jgi:DNA-directed RNA polymerase specialized sigma24 family protein
MMRGSDPFPDRFAKAVALLPDIEREVFLLSARDGLADGEVAARLGIPAAAVRHHLADALVHIDRHLDRMDRPWWRLW